MDSLLESMGLLCMAVRNNPNNDIGRTKLQKMIYFADRYLGWDVGDYKLHYYGPYSRNIASTLKIVRTSLIDETIPKHGHYEYNLTDAGNQFIDEFVDDVCDEEKTQHTSELFKELSRWDRKQLEIASTIDYVQKSNASLDRDGLLERVQAIKDNFDPEFISTIHDKWDKWKEAHRF